MKNTNLWKILICLTLFIMVTSCGNGKTTRELDLPYPHDADEVTKQKWIDDKVKYLEKHYEQEVIDIKEDDESITFVFKTEHMSPKVQVKEECYMK